MATDSFLFNSLLNLMVYYEYPCSLVTKLYQTLCDPLDCSLPSSSVHGISKARMLEQVAISFSRIFPIQGLNLHLLHWQVGYLPLITKEALVSIFTCQEKFSGYRMSFMGLHHHSYKKFLIVEHLVDSLYFMLL